MSRRTLIYGIRAFLFSCLAILLGSFAKIGHNPFANTILLFGLALFITSIVLFTVAILRKPKPQYD
jgi:cell shape-determining protein MreD